MTDAAGIGFRRNPLISFAFLLLLLKQTPVFGIGIEPCESTGSSQNAQTSWGLITPPMLEPSDGFSLPFSFVDSSTNSECSAREPLSIEAAQILTKRSVFEVEESSFLELTAPLMCSTIPLLNTNERQYIIVFSEGMSREVAAEAILVAGGIVVDNLNPDPEALRHAFLISADDENVLSLLATISDVVSRDLLCSVCCERS